MFTDIEDFVGRIKMIKGDANMKDFAKKCGIPYGTMNSIINGSWPSIDKTARIASAGGVSIDWLFYGLETEAGEAHLVHIKQLNAKYKINDSRVSSDLTNLALHLGWINQLVDNYIDVQAIKVFGNDMASGSNDGIRDGDIVLIDGGTSELTQSGIYCFILNDRLMLRRVQCLVTGEIIISSDSGTDKEYRVSKEDAQTLDFYGKVFWHSRELL